MKRFAEKLISNRNVWIVSVFVVYFCRSVLVRWCVFLHVSKRCSVLCIQLRYLNQADDFGQDRGRRTVYPCTAVQAIPAPNATRPDVDNGGPRCRAGGFHGTI